MATVSGLSAFLAIAWALVQEAPPLLGYVGLSQTGPLREVAPCCFLLSLAAVALLSRRVERDGWRGLVGLTGAVGAICTLLALTAVILDEFVLAGGPPLLVPGIALGLLACGCACGLMSWCLTLVRRAPGGFAAPAALGLAIGSIVQLPLLLLPMQADIFIYLALLFPVAYGCLFYCQLGGQAEGSSMPSAEPSPDKTLVTEALYRLAPRVAATAILVLACMAVCSYELARYTARSVTPKMAIMAAVCTACSLAILALQRVKFPVLRRTTLFKLVVPLCAAVLVACTLIPVTLVHVALYAFLSFALVTLMLGALEECARLAAVRSVRRASLFAGLLLLALAPWALSLPIDLILIRAGRDGYPLRELMAIFLFFMFTLLGSYLLYYEAKTQQPTSVDDVKLRCAALAQTRGLTVREQQVLELFCKGRSVPAVANSLSISENTVKTYQRGLYAALGVHSRQELIDLVEQTDAGRFA